MTIDIKSMGYVRVASTDLDAWATFAGKVLGLAAGRGPDPGPVTEPHHPLTHRTTTAPPPKETTMSRTTKKAKTKAKRGLFALLGRLVWAILARIGVPYAKKQVEQRDRRR